MDIIEKGKCNWSPSVGLHAHSDISLLHNTSLFGRADRVWLQFALTGRWMWARVMSLCQRFQSFSYQVWLKEVSRLHIGNKWFDFILSLTYKIDDYQRRIFFYGNTPYPNIHVQHICPVLTECKQMHTITQKQRIKIYCMFKNIRKPYITFPPDWLWQVWKDLGFRQRKPLRNFRPRNEFAYRTYLDSVGF